MSLSDTKKAIQKLLLSNNLEYAYVVSSLFYPKALDYILSLLFVKTLEADASYLAAKILEGINDKTLQELLNTSLQMSVNETEEDEEEKSKPNTANVSVVKLLCEKNFT